MWRDTYARTVLRALNHACRDLGQPPELSSQAFYIVLHLLAFCDVERDANQHRRSIRFVASNDVGAHLQPVKTAVVSDARIASECKTGSRCAPQNPKQH